MCDRFLAGLAARLAAAEKGAMLSDYTFVLAIEQDRTLTATIRRAGAASAAYPAVAVDVFDRKMKMSDFDTLAGAAARSLLDGGLAAE